MYIYVSDIYIYIYIYNTYVYIYTYVCAVPGERPRRRGWSALPCIPPRTAPSPTPTPPREDVSPLNATWRQGVIAFRRHGGRTQAKAVFHAAMIFTY